MRRRWKFTIFCLATDNFQSEIPRKMLLVAAIRYPKRFTKPVVRPLLEFQYKELMKKVSKKFKNVDDNHCVMIFANNKYILMSQLLELLKKEKCGITMMTKPEVEACWTRHLFNNLLISPKRDYLYLNIHIGGKHIGFIILEVFTDINPKISNTFVQLFTMNNICIGHYHVFKEGWLEFGINPPAMPGRGNNHHQLMSHKVRGTLSFCQDFDNRCDAFFLHFVPCTFFDEFRTVLGRVVHGDRILEQIEELESEFGRLNQDFCIYSWGIVPIGRNQSEEIDKSWEEAMYMLFEAPGPIAQSNKLVEETDDNAAIEIVCPMFGSSIELREESASESVSTKSTNGSILTAEPWDLPMDIGAITFNYSEDPCGMFDWESATCKESKESFHMIDPRANVSLIDVSFKTPSLIDLGEIDSSENLRNPIHEIHAISMADIAKKKLRSLDRASYSEDYKFYTQAVLEPSSSIIQIFPVGGEPTPQTLNTARVSQQKSIGRESTPKNSIDDGNRNEIRKQSSQQS